jgi:regulatory protein
LSDAPSENTLIRKKAMDYLSRREHSRYELYQKLSKHNFERVLINEQLEKLANENLLSDQRYVEAFIDSRKRNGKGPVKISAELLERRVDEQLIYNSINEVDDDEWLGIATTVLEKKLGNNQQLDYDNQLKLMKFLSNRGFTMDQIKTTVERFKKE